MSAKQSVEKKVAEKPAAKVAKINYAQAANMVCAALDGKSSADELALEADSLVVESGGKSNLRTAKYRVVRALLTAEAMGVVRLFKPTDMLVERLKK